MSHHKNDDYYKHSSNYRFTTATVQRQPILKNNIRECQLGYYRLQVVNQRRPFRESVSQKIEDDDFSTSDRNGGILHSQTAQEQLKMSNKITGK